VGAAAIWAAQPRRSFFGVLIAAMCAVVAGSMAIPVDRFSVYPVLHGATDASSRGRRAF